ncbi:MAG: CHAT domain-containing tetratricopeptide repeat protein [Planctomycetota bacterium]
MASVPEKAAITERLLRIDDPEERDRFIRTHLAELDVEVVERLKGAVDYYIRADVQRALVIAETARAVAGYVPDPLADAVSLRALAEAHHVSSRHGEALRCYDEAIAIYKRLGSDVEAARLQRNEIPVLMYMGRYSDALAVAEEARSVFLEHGQECLAAQVETHVGNIYHRMDDPQTALRYYDKARAVFETSGDEFSQALVEYNRANILAFLNDFETAESLYGRARELYRKRGFLLLAADVDYNLAFLCSLRSRFFEALTVLKGAHKLYESGNELQGCALCDLDLAEIYLTLNLPREARASASKARHTFSSLGMRYEEAKATSHLANAAGRLGQRDEALRLFERSEALFRSEGNAFQLGCVSLSRAELLLGQGESFAAAELAREAQTLFEAVGAFDWLCHARLALAEAERHQGQADRAWEIAESALSSLGDRDRPGLRYRCHHLLGRVLADRGEIHGADQHLSRSLDEIERIWRDVRLDQFRVAFLHDKERAYADALRVKLLQGGVAGIAAAFTCAERGRARSIVEMLARHSMPKARQKAGVSPELYQRFTRLREELDWFYGRSGNRDIVEPESRRPADPDRFRADLDRRERELAELRKMLRAVDREFSDLHGFYAVQADDVRSTLQPSETLLEYFITGEEILLFVVRNDEILVRTCPTARNRVVHSLQGLRFQLDKFLYGSDYSKAHGAALRRSVDRHLNDLYDQLLAPISELIDQRDLLIVPHGPLHYVPFHALRDRNTYVIERQAVSYAPSAHVYCLASQRPPSAARTFTIVGAPDSSAPGIEDEVRSLASLDPEAHLLLAEHATRQALNEACRGSRILHLSTHGVFRSDNPMLSHLHLADGPLNVYDIYNLEIEADLVTLSGCETGVSEVANGDELLGLTRGFLHAGATSLLVSLWPVSDRSTPRFMEHFYRELNGGKRPRHAVRSAQLALLDIYGHPFHWAPFLVSGQA